MIFLPEHTKNLANLRLILPTWKSIKNCRIPLRALARSISLKCLLATAVVFGIVYVATVQLLLRFYTYEADVRLIYMDTARSLKDAKEDGMRIDVWGWDYFESIKELGLDPLEASDLLTTEANNVGYWITKPTTTQTTPFNWIRFTRFQFSQLHDVTLAFRHYVRGTGRIHVRLQDDLGRSSTSVFDKNGANSSAFCSQIVQIPPSRRIRQITITAEHLGPQSLIAIDKVILAVGDDRRNLHMIFTMLPTGWCSDGGLSAVTNETYI